MMKEQPALPEAEAEQDAVAGEHYDLLREPQAGCCEPVLTLVRRPRTAPGRRPDCRSMGGLNSVRPEW
jgi:hypothetical protein